MEKRLVTKEELQALTDPLPPNVNVVGFRIVALGPNTMELAGRLGAKICEIVEEKPSFFIISETPEELRQAMHDLVDRFCNAKEGK